MQMWGGAVGAGYWRPTVLEPGKSTRVIGPVKTGDLITYTLEVRNAGDTLAMGVVITDPLPEGVSFVSASDNGQSTPAGVVWHLPNIPPGQTVSVQVVVQVGNPTGNTLIINIFTASNDGLPGRSVVQDSNQVSTPFAPTAVTLASFYATAEGRGVRVTWQTALERNTFGFNVLRSVTGNRADATQVNAEMVIAAGPNTYSLVDEGGSVGNTYWLEEMELDGDRIDYGPVVAQAVLPGVTQPQPSQPNAPPALQPAPGGGGVNVLGGGVPVAQPAVAQPAQPVAQPQAQPAAQQPAVIPAVPAVIAPETQPQPRPEAQPVAELPQQPIAQSVQPASEPQVQPAAEQPQPPVAQPAPAMPAATAPPVEQVVVGAETGVSVARGGQPAAVQLPASTTPAVEPVSETQPVNPLIPAGAGVLALLGLGAAGVFIMRRKRAQ